MTIYVSGRGFIDGGPGSGPHSGMSKPGYAEKEKTLEEKVKASKEFQARLEKARKDIEMKRKFVGGRSAG